MKVINKSAIKGLCLFLFAGLYPGINFGQHFNDMFVQEWANGKVTLSTGESIDGAIAYHRTEEVIRVIKEDGSVSSYSPVSVDSFVAADSRSGRYNVFQTIDWNQGRVRSDFKKPVFFEVLHNGNYSLIARSTYIRLKDYNKVLSGSSFVRRYDDWVEEVKMSYYVQKPDGEIIELRKLQRDLFKLMGGKKNEVKTFIKEKHLDINMPHELSIIIGYFNSLI
ncbi:hypothetical protein [Pontibacter sp. SGAir0037]|uniref:hypothetical protein n=1 Tax=Pontibacter sp. SGAir0037 TaxID=2571030 RepID=UPI0010F5E9F9|nr:hypothetical protein [Pontibacter sp. SGAir0037]